MHVQAFKIYVPSLAPQNLQGVKETHQQGGIKVVSSWLASPRFFFSVWQSTRGDVVGKGIV